MARRRRWSGVGGVGKMAESPKIDFSGSCTHVPSLMGILLSHGKIT